MLRRLIGCDAERDRFPATSTNRTTTCEIEIITGRKDFAAAVTFLTRHQTQQEVIESVSNAVLKAIEGAPDAVVMKDLLDDSDQRFRLKYALGDWQTPKPKAGGGSSFDAPVKGKAESKLAESSEFLKATLAAIWQIAEAARKEVEPVLGALETLKDEERSYALDEMQQAGEQSNEFLDLVNEIMDEITERFSALQAWC